MSATFVHDAVAVESWEPDRVIRWWPLADGEAPFCGAVMGARRQDGKAELMADGRMSVRIGTALGPRIPAGTPVSAEHPGGMP